MTEFEDFYRQFMAAGGFAQKAMGEDFERMLRASRDQPEKSLERCKHGLTYLTCSQCYLYFQKGESP